MTGIDQLPEHIRAKIATGCWAWTGATTGQGYGQVAVARRSRQAHVVVYELLVGPVPDGLELDHLCRNRACVNPAHLEAVTHAENVRRAVRARPVPTHCRHGHELTPENLYHYLYDGRLHRICRTCRLATQARVRARRREAAGVDDHRCTAITTGPDNRTGERCGCRALIGGTLCHNHEPSHADRRARRVEKSRETRRSKASAS